MNAVIGTTGVIEVILVGVWTYLVWMVRKKKTNIKRLKTFLLVAGISLAVGIVGVVAHNAIYGLSKIEEPVSMGIGFLGLMVFVIATIGGLVIFLKGRRKTT